MSHIKVEALLGPSPNVDLWVSCHGYESRSTAHLDALGVNAKRRISFGFPFPSAEDGTHAASRIRASRERLTKSSFEIPIVDDTGFDLEVRKAINELKAEGPCSIAADISSMSRSRMASLFLALSERGGREQCVLDVIYFPGLFDSHKHAYEPLEHFGPCHASLCGWPADPDLPLAVILGLGTEPRRADGVLEMLEPDILALYMPVGDEAMYQSEIQEENRRVLEVGGEPVLYNLRDPAAVFSSLVATAGRLSQRSRIVFVPLGPKIFVSLTIAAALELGDQVGVWKASAGRGVEPVDVQASKNPIFFRVSFAPSDPEGGSVPGTTW